MKIGLITPGWPGHKTPNGIATSVYHLAMGLRANNHTPVIITSKIDGALPEGIPVTTYESRPWGFTHKIRRRLGAQNVATDLMAQGRADAVSSSQKKHMATPMRLLIVRLPPLLCFCTDLPFFLMACMSAKKPSILSVDVKQSPICSKDRR